MIPFSKMPPKIKLPLLLLSFLFPIQSLGFCLKFVSLWSQDGCQTTRHHVITAPKTRKKEKHTYRQFYLTGKKIFPRKSPGNFFLHFIGQKCKSHNWLMPHDLYPWLGTLLANSISKEKRGDWCWVSNQQCVSQIYRDLRFQSTIVVISQSRFLNDGCDDDEGHNDDGGDDN